MTSVELNDGTVLDVAWCGEAGGLLSMHPTQEMTIAEAVNIFTPAQMARVAYHYGEMQDVFDGYIEMMVANRDSITGQITLTFGKAG